MLQNAYFIAKIGADTAENEQHFAEILPKIGNYPTGPLVDCGVDAPGVGKLQGGPGPARARVLIHRLRGHPVHPAVEVGSPGCAL